MNRLHLKFSLACLAALVAAGSAANAQGSLLGISASSTQGNQLIRIDPATGVGTPLAPLGGAPGALEGVAVSGGNFYVYDTAANALRGFDTGTGALTSNLSLGISNRIGEGGVTFGGGAGYLFTPLNAATFAPVNELYTFNPLTGASTLLGSTGGLSLSALTFANNTLYGLGKDDGLLYSLSATTGAPTLIGDTGVVLGSPIAALSAGPNGSLFGALNDALYTINPATGAATPIGDPAIGVGFSSISGLAFTPSAVPEPGAVGLFAGAMAFGGAFALRRRRK